MTYLVLLATVSPQVLRDAMLAAMTAANLPTSTWTKEGFFQNLVNWIALLFQVAYNVLREVALNAFLGTATEQGLTDLAAGTYGTARRIQTFATGIVTLWNQSGSTLDEDTEAVSFELVGDSSITYKNSEPIFALNGQIVFVPIVCDVAGTVGNAAPGTSPTHTIELQTVLTGVTVTQNGAIVGQDAQTDEALRDLASKQAAVASKAHGNKYEWIALNTNTDGTIAEANDGKTRTNVNRVLVSFEDAQGRVFVTLASPSGPVDPTEYTTTIGAITQRALTNPGILIDNNATAVPVTIEVDVVLRRGTSPNGVESEVFARLVDYFPTTSIGGDDGFLTIEELELEIGRANSRIVEVTMVTPAADVPLADTEVAVLSGTPVINITVQA